MILIRDESSRSRILDQIHLFLAVMLDTFSSTLEYKSIINVKT